jgi:ABC-type methionine transport system permease subunit
VLVVLVLVLCLSGAASAQGLVGAGGVGLLGMGPGWYVGAQRVTSFLVTREGITEVANVALSATIRGCGDYGHGCG